jgi:hypothetical protein
VENNGGLSVGTRLDRIENKIDEIGRRLEVFATEGALHDLAIKVERIDQQYVRRNVLWAVIAFAFVQLLVIIGLGLGLIYEVLRP